MPITQRQFEQLSAMGIPLWQLSNRTEQSTAKQSETSVTQRANINLAELSEQVLFKDILHSIKLSITDISCVQDQLDFGLFNWQFQPTSAAQPSIKFDTHMRLLTTPELAIVAHSSSLKQQLWQQLSQLTE